MQAGLDALRAPADLASALEAQVADAGALLAKLCERLEEIEAGGWEAERPWIERLVQRITVTWDPNAKPWNGPVTVGIEYVFGPGAVVASTAVYPGQLGRPRIKLDLRRRLGRRYFGRPHRRRPSRTHQSDGS